ncbi:hypothetical protein ACLWBD_07690 [Bdellovibrio sp. HCB117]|uniref:hypothetical protein n=1 Tax=Bdellovibrio sp. HCB117 TaxID=3394359 RepID=UPI0039B46CEA
MKRPYSDKMNNIADYFDRYIQTYANKYGFDYSEIQKKMGITESLPLGVAVDQYAEENIFDLIPKDIPKAERNKLDFLLGIRGGIDSLHFKTFDIPQILEVTELLIEALVSLHHTPPSTKAHHASPRLGKKNTATQFMRNLAILYFKTRPDSENRDLYRIMTTESLFEDLQREFNEGTIELEIDWDKSSSEILFYRDSKGSTGAFEERNLKNIISKARTDSAWYKFEDEMP